MSTLVSPARIWWKPLGKQERLWVGISLVWCLFLFAMMFIWMGVGRQQTPTETYRVSIAQWNSAASAFVEKYKVGTENGVAVVRPPSGSDV